MDIYIALPWGNIAARTKGLASDPPILCLHGYQDTLATFTTILPMLPEDRYYVLVDLPGHGFSSRLPAGCFYSYYNFAATVERIRQYFQWEVFSLIGHSFGGNVASLYSSIFPEKVDKLIIIDMFGMKPVPDENFPEVSRNAIETIISRELLLGKNPSSHTYNAAKARLLNASPTLTTDAADILLERSLKKLDNQDGEYCFARDPRLKDISLWPSQVSFISYSLAPEFCSKVKAEILHFMCSNGGIFTDNSPFAFIVDLFTKSEHHEKVTVEGGHYVHLCNPELIAPHICKHIRRPLRKGLLQDNPTVSKL